MSGAEVLSIKASEQKPVLAEYGNIRWWTAAAYAEVFFDDRGLRLEEWLDSGQATVVKTGPHRVVYRVDLPELSFILKHNLVADRRAWLRQLFRASKARMEFRRAIAVARRGIATIEPLALGERRQSFGSGESYLITRTLPGTMQLNEFIEQALPMLPPHDRSRFRRRLAQELGVFIADLHGNGILHNDLHCGNILIQTDGEYQPRFFLIDLQAVRINRTLSAAQSKANLVVLNRWLMYRASRSDRLRFWYSYLQRRGGIDRKSLPVTLEGLPEKSFRKAFAAPLALELEQATRRSNERFWRHRELRCLQKTRHTRRLRTPTMEGYAAADLNESLVSCLLNDPETLFQRRDAIVLKDSRSAKVVELPGHVAGQDRPVIFKRFAVTQTLDPLLARLRPSPTLRSWINGHGLRERGLPTARPLAMLHRRRWGLCYEGYLLMEKVNAEGDLRGTLETLCLLPAIQRRRLLRQRVEELARLIRELHLRQLAHRDLKAANVLLDADQLSAADPEPSGDQSNLGLLGPFCFIDLVGVKRSRTVNRATRIKNLARLHASFWSDSHITRTDKLRFLRTYLQWGVYGKEGWKAWWRKIEQATQFKIRKNLRNNRPLA